MDYFCSYKSIFFIFFVFFKTDLFVDLIDPLSLLFFCCVFLLTIKSCKFFSIFLLATWDLCILEVIKYFALADITIFLITDKRAIHKNDMIDGGQ